MLISYWVEATFIGFRCFKGCLKIHSVRMWDKGHILIYTIWSKLFAGQVLKTACEGYPMDKVPFIQWYFILTHCNSLEKGCLKNPLGENVRQRFHLPTCIIWPKSFGGWVTAYEVEPMDKSGIYPTVPHFNTLLQIWEGLFEKSFWWEYES